MVTVGVLAANVRSAEEYMQFSLGCAHAKTSEWIAAEEAFTGLSICSRLLKH